MQGGGGSAPKKKGLCSNAHKPLKISAEREGFEPPVPEGTLDFESSTIDHSATSPLDWNLGRFAGGETGIRTPETLLTFTHFPGVLLKPLGHLSKIGAFCKAGAKVQRTLQFDKQKKHKNFFLIFLKKNLRG